MDTLNYILDNLIPIEYFTPGSILQDNMPVEIPNINRDMFADLLKELGYKIGVEIGVESGLYSDVLLKANPNLTLYSVDPWKSYRAYRDHTSQEKLDRFYEETKAILAPYGDRSKIVRKSSMEAVNDFADNSLDFVYIDGNHAFMYVAEDIHMWLKKIRPGGIISGHDYKKHKEGVNIHVKQVVQGFTDAYYIKPWFVLGRSAKVEGEIRDGSRSWFWVKK